MTKLKIQPLLLVIFFLPSCYLFAQTSSLVLEEIMAGNEFIGEQPDNIRWSPDSKTIIFDWGKDENWRTKTFQFKVGGRVPVQLDEFHEQEIPSWGLVRDLDRKYSYYQNGSSIFQYSEAGTKKVFSFYDQFNLLKVFSDGSLLLRLKNNIVEFDPSKGTFKQMLITGGSSTDQEKNWLENQQIELFEIIEKQEAKRNVVRNSPLPKAIIDDQLDWIDISENKEFSIFQETNYPKNSENTLYPSYVTADGQTQLKKARPKVGAKDPTHQLYVLDLKSNLSKQVKININDLTGIMDLPDYSKYYDVKKNESIPKNVTFHNHGSNSAGKLFLVEIKSYDNKDRWICTVDIEGNLNEHIHQRDTAWIGGPGISGWNMVPGNVGWINDHEFYYQSEESGYSHLYIQATNSDVNRQLTKGKFEIHEAILSNNKEFFWVTANKEHPGDRGFYKLEIKGGKLIPILINSGNHEVSISPDEKHLAIRYSYKNKPWEVYYAPLKENSDMFAITQSTTEKFNAYQWREPEVIVFKASDNEDVYARLYKPGDNKNGAAVIFVHGAGYLQNAHNWWSGYYREYMFHNLLVDKGFTVLDIDYRASKGYGRDHRTAIYRFMGGKDLSDHVDGRQWLIDNEGIDPNRVGIYGGSYGGFITLMALLTEPGKFKCGAAIRSVTDWAHYNHEYTSNILNTPEADPIAFKRSSPIYFAENLQDRLLMLHGMEDDNVQYQDVVRLSQRFIELQKKNWDLIGYPIEPHGFNETTSWIDEYGRILQLFEEELLQN